MKLTKENIILLEEIKQTYIRSADNIPGWKTMDKNKLANLYLEYENVEPERSYYFSALMCRYWKNVHRFYKTSTSTRLEIEDFTNWLAESFFIAFKYRRWKDPSNKLYNDPQAPDKVINRCIYSTRMRYYQYYNMDKRRLNFQTDSIERQLGSFGHQANVYSYLGVEDTDKHEDVCKDIINYYLSKKSILQAIIVDLICFSDTFKIKVDNNIFENIDLKDFSNDDKFDDNIIDDIIIDDNNDDNDDDIMIEDFDSEDNNYDEDIVVESNQATSYSYELSTRKLLRILRGITKDEDYVNYFNFTYGESKEEIIKCLSKISDAEKRRQLPRLIKHVIQNISTDGRVKEILCL